MKDPCSWWGAWKERWNWQVLSAFRGNGCSAGSLSSLPSKGGDRATLEELRLRAEAYARVEHWGSTLWPAHTERERAQPAGRERPRRRLFVGFACRGLPQGAPRMTLPLVLPPPLISFSLSLSPCPTFLGKIRKEDNFVINNSRERSCDYISNSRKKIESIPDEIHVYIYIFFPPPSLILRFVDSPAMDRYSSPRYRVIDVSCDIILSLSLSHRFSFAPPCRQAIFWLRKENKDARLKIWFVRFNLFRIIDRRGRKDRKRIHISDNIV